MYAHTHTHTQIQTQPLIDCQEKPSSKNIKNHKKKEFFPVIIILYQTYYIPFIS